jgi:hypothetical protein
MSFKRLDTEDITISAESVVAPAWTGQVTSLSTTNFVTASAQATVNRYYYDIYQTTPSATGAAIQFSLAYGNRKGSGSQNITLGENGKSPSSIIYGQYRTLINGDENTDFTFGNITPNSIFVITVNRSRYKEKLLPGSFNLSLTNGATTLNLTDNSQVLSTISYTDSGRVYDIVSGSNGTPFTALNTLGYSHASGSYGKFLPDVGVIVLNGEALKANISTGGGLGLSIDETSAVGLTSSPNLSTFYNIVKAGGRFVLQSEETITSNYVFIRVRNGEYNYSTNPSIITGSGELRYDVLINTPQAYLTTVGLYNDNNDLLGVAKLSRPLLKDFTKEALIRIKLDY